MEVIVPAQPEPIKLDIARMALVVVDMQNSFCKKGGMFDYLGKLNEVKTKRVIEVDKQVIEAFRNKAIKIIYLRMTYGPDLAGSGGLESPNSWKESGLVAMRQHPEMKGKFLTLDTRDWEIVDELKPATDDITINKSRYSGFVNTELDDILKKQNIKYLAFIGLFTNVCVESTLRDAFFHEYFPLLVSDACGNTGPDYVQDATVWNVSSVFGWVTTAGDLIKSLK
ncbi:MAG: isochorismatase family protein [Dehalococcoidales bacterium]|nr:isochorismatase family protein [Dehalococcoidales bacterium]